MATIAPTKRLARPEIREVAYQETEHYRVTRDFLASPERFFKHLFSGESGKEGDA
jgi:predicted ATPase